jgi:Na+/melibiose symporter-like transporter
VAISWGVMGGLEIYMGLYFWKLSQSELAILATMSVVGGFLGVIAGPLIGRYLGKKWGLIWVFIAMVIIHVAPIVLRLTGLAPENGTNALFALIFGQTLFNAILESAVTVLGIAIFADIVEDVEVQTGRRSEGLLMSASSLMRKMVSGGGILISTMLLTITHFPVGMAPEKIPDAVLRNLGMAYVPTIVILNGIAIGLLCFFSIDRNRHEENLRKLKELADVRALAEAEQEAAIL